MPIVQLEDGSFWLLRRYREYRVLEPGKLC